MGTDRRDPRSGIGELSAGPVGTGHPVHGREVAIPSAVDSPSAARATERRDEGDSTALLAATIPSGGAADQEVVGRALALLGIG
jgi:hypothetical protein